MDEAELDDPPLTLRQHDVHAPAGPGAALRHLDKGSRLGLGGSLALHGLAVCDRD